MTHYRMLFLNDASQVIGAANIERESDVEAMAAAETWLKWHAGIEVWEGHRVVCSVGGRTAWPDGRSSHRRS